MTKEFENDKNLIRETAYLIPNALAVGFAKAAVMEVKDLVYVPEYRRFCEENLCGNYNLLPVCPPTCGTSDAMHERMLKYSKALVLQTELVPVKKEHAEYLAGKKAHNMLLEKLIAKLEFQDILVMSCGPWKSYSCMSAYSIDAEKMANHCGMICWGHDGIIRFFSSILFN